LTQGVAKVLKPPKNRLAQDAARCGMLPLHADAALRLLPDASKGRGLREKRLQGKKRRRGDPKGPCPNAGGLAHGNVRATI